MKLSFPSRLLSMLVQDRQDIVRGSGSLPRNFVMFEFTRQRGHAFNAGLKEILLNVIFNKSCTIYIELFSLIKKKEFLCL